ncbi:GntR family transcriptional regulator [Antarctobacter sp.]|uniref:GntR family transcriptional regulator n=1 Tax=Antarctobacter sp. TaxID=1872577 RepID=UPI002B26A04E|nr:GntR family transcriptional regulator [Antarctobacter sp.]
MASDTGHERGKGTASARSDGAATRVYDELRREIISFERAPGSVLSRATLEKQYSVSQTPIREALQMLDQDGLVQVFPQSRTLVSRIDVQQLNETHFLRVAVEVEVAWRLAAAPRDDVIARARAIVQMQKALLGDIDQAELFHDLDRSFHKTLFDAVGVGSIQQILARRLGHLLRCQQLDLPSQGKMATIVADHEAILNAISVGDQVAATEAVRRHLSGTINRVDALRAQHPDFFTDGKTWPVWSTTDESNAGAAR